jgi:uncharacterized protein (TIGR03000 family)
MFLRLIPCLGTSAVALGTLLVVAAPATAQQHGHRGGSSFGNSHGSGFHAGYNNSPYYGGNYGPRYYPGGYSPYYPQYYGYQYAPDTYGYDSNNYSSAPSSSYREDGRMAMYPSEDQNVARINVRVPPSAQVWFDGAKTTQTGSLREFTSPPINSDSEYSYEIRAHWMEGGQDVERNQKVSFHAGDRVTVNFVTRQVQGADVNGKREKLTQTSPAATRIEAVDQNLDFANQKRD